MDHNHEVDLQFNEVFNADDIEDNLDAIASDQMDNYPMEEVLDMDVSLDANDNKIEDENQEDDNIEADHANDEIEDDIEDDDIGDDNDDDDFEADHDNNEIEDDNDNENDDIGDDDDDDDDDIAALRDQLHLKQNILGLHLDLVDVYEYLKDYHELSLSLMRLRKLEVISQQAYTIIALII